MRLLLALLFSAFLLLAQTGEDAIRAVLREQVTAWNRGDIAGFMQGYEDSPQTAFVGKEVARGYAQVLQRYRERYASREKMGTLSFTDLEVRLLGTDHASVIGRFHLKREAQGGGDATGIFTLLFRSSPKGWKIILDHTS